MSAAVPDLAGAPWLTAPRVQRVFATLEAEGHEARIVGGAVRNALMGRPVGEIDFATTATPDTVAALAAAAGLKTVPTGVEHGTQTVIVDGAAFEVTTLREDIETDGRHAVVRFGSDWTADARRRDFTINALSVDRAGKVHDPVGGYPDILARRVRFIGEAGQRIAEDRLRILRFFRFSAEHGGGVLDHDGLLAAIRARNGLRDLSAERIGKEMRRLVVAPAADIVATAMQDAGLLPIVLGGVGYVARFSRLVACERALAAEPSVPLRLAGLACRIAEDVQRLVARLRLANAERDAMLALLSTRSDLTPMPDLRAARAALYRRGAAAWRGGVRLALAESGAAPDSADWPAWRALDDLPNQWTPPSFPLTGRDVVGPGTPPGPAVGALLRSVEAWWIAEDFAPDAAALRARLQQLIASVQ